MLLLSIGKRKDRGDPVEGGEEEGREREGED
jgi:hypothetical protein